MSEKLSQLYATAPATQANLIDVLETTQNVSTTPVSKALVLSQVRDLFNTALQIAATSQITGFNAAAAAAAPVQSVAGKTGAVTLTPNNITNLYGSGGVQSPVTGAATTYSLTYPLAPRYIFTPNAGVTLVVTLLAYDAAQCVLGQPLEFVNNGGANSAVQLFDNSGNFITNTSIGTGQSFNGRIGVNTISSIRLGTAASANTSDFQPVSTVLSGLASLDTTTGLIYQSAANTFKKTALSYTNLSLAVANTPLSANMSSIYNITSSSSSNAIALPNMTTVTNVNPGNILLFKNVGGIAFNVNYNDGTLLTAVQPGQTLILEVLIVSFANGAYAYDLIGFTKNIIVETTTARSLTATDNGAYIICTNASPVAVTVNSTYPGFNCFVKQKSTGQITFTSPLTLNSANNAFKTRAPFSGCNVVQDTTSTVQLDGDLTQ